MTNKVKIENLLSKIEHSPTECDGFVRLANFLLDNEGIQHRIFYGHLTLNNGRSTPPHFWIETENYRIDYRARMWLGNDAPHGVFDKSIAYGYEGKIIEIEKINQQLFDLLCLPFVDKL